MRMFSALLLALPLAATPVFGGAAPTNLLSSTSRTNSTASLVNPDEVVARVDSREIKRKELDIAMQAVEAQLAQNGQMVSQERIPAMEHRVLDDMIDRELILEEGLRQPLPGLDAKFQQGLKQVQSQLGGEEALSNSLKEAGLTFDEYAKRARENVIIQDTLLAVLDREVKVTPEEIKAFYESNLDKMKQPATVRASHILIRVSPTASEDIRKGKRAQIDAARSLVTSGEKFADVARKVSEDPVSAANGGDLGFFARGQMVTEFEQAAMSLKTNEVSDVINTQYGYHLLMVTDRKPARQASLEEVNADIEKLLRYQKSTEVTRRYIKGLRDKAKIQVFLKPLPPAATPLESPAAPLPKP